MNKITAIVTHINNIDNLNIVKFDYYETQLTMMSLDLDKNIKIGTKVNLVVNPSHIAIAKDFNGKVSYSNQLKTTIKSIENGKLLSSISLNLQDNTILESIITLSSSNKMNLKVNDNIIAFIKASELSIMEVIE